MSQNIYDNDEFFKAYNNMREEEGKKSANDLIEMPTIYSMLPNLKKKVVLDLGCGSGNNCKKAIELGAKYALGTDILNKMIALANESNDNNNIEYKVMSMEDIDKISEKFDVIISSLAVHYVKDYEKIVKKVYDLLNNDGYFIFSQEHPIGTCTILNEECTDNSCVIGNKKYYLLSDYNINGERRNEWFEKDVIKYHRNFSYIINTLIKVGFKIEEIIEPILNNETLILNPKHQNQFDKPYFLFIKVKK